MDEQLDQLVNDAHIDALLDLLFISCSNVGERPAHFLPYGLLLVEDYIVKGLKSTCFNHILCCSVITSHDIANCPQAGDSNSNITVLQ